MLADVHAISVEGARAFVEAVYQDVSDSELWQRLGLPRVADGGGLVVSLTSLGRDFLNRHRGVDRSPGTLRAP